MEITFTSPDMWGKGRNFDCSKCLEQVKNRRRCAEDRWDFDHTDSASVFPIQIYEGGNKYGFCPAKVTWLDQRHLQSKFKLLLIAAETKQLLVKGGILDQPNWFIEALVWFLPKVDMIKFTTKAKMVLGDGKPNPKDKIGKKHGR